MIKKIKHHRLISLFFLVSLVLVVGGFSWAIAALTAAASGPIILHFNDMAGITSVGGFGDLVLMGILGIVIVVIDFFIALGLAERDGVLGKVVATTTLIMAVLLFLAFAAIIKVN